MIIGGGAIGRLMAVMLDSCGEVILVPSSRSFTTLQGGALSVKGVVNKKAKIQVRELRTLSTEEMNQAIIVVCVKAFVVRDIISDLSSLLNPENTVCLLQNGLGIQAFSQPLVRREIPCVRGLVRVGSRSVSPTEVECTGIGGISLAPCVSSMKEAAERVGVLFEKAAIPVVYKESAVRAEWEKCLLNVVTNSLCTLLECENGVVNSDPEVKSLAEKLLQESAEVARSEGVDFSPAELRAVFEAVAKVAANTNSTLMDIRARRRTETEYLLGEVVRRARERKVSVNTAEIVLTLLKAKERLAGSSW